MAIKASVVSFFEKEQSRGILLIGCTLLSLLLTNSAAGGSYLHLWHVQLLYKPLEFWVNDGLMAIFFLYVGLEIKREILAGELSNRKAALLPVLAAVGGMVVPAAIHYGFNRHSNTQNGFGIPMATDIAFSLGILSLLGSRVPAALKVFLTALAIIDDLGAIIVIALFYSAHFSLLYFALAIAVFALLLLFNKLKLRQTGLYLALGGLLWYCMYRSGVHATIAGILLAIALPFNGGSNQSVSARLEHSLHKPVAFCILPLFALVNTVIPVSLSLMGNVFMPNGYGIMLGLLAGKPLGIVLLSWVGVATGLGSLPDGVTWQQVTGMGLLAGIGFTMSVFITLLAFTGNPVVIDSSKIAVLVASALSGVLGFTGLKISLARSVKI